MSSARVHCGVFCSGCGFLTSQFVRRFRPLPSAWLSNWLSRKSSNYPLSIKRRRRRATIRAFKLPISSGGLCNATVRAFIGGAGKRKHGGALALPGLVFRPSGSSSGLSKPALNPLTQTGINHKLGNPIRGPYLHRKIGGRPKFASGRMNRKNHPGIPFTLVIELH